ncbi:MAG: segregation/condensation protein A, partial [Phycisphaerales bacterium]|nr:segregation/condensation protein A [Phycisphaerales bacterium]
LDLDEVQIWDLLEAFTRVMREIGFRRPKYHEVEYDETPIELHAADIEDRLRREGRITFRSLLEGRRSRSEMIGVFLALLELIREKKVLAHQNESSGEIEMEAAPESHRRTFAHASLHLANPTPDPAPDSRIETSGDPGDAHAPA